MSSLSERWFGRFSDDYWDLTTTRAFLMGLLGNVLYLLLFVLLLALTLDGTDMTAGEGTVAAVGYFLAILGGVLIGGGSIYRFHTSERVRDNSKRFDFRTVAVVGFFGLYWLLANYRPAYAVWFGITYLAARTFAYVVIYVAPRI